MFVAAIKCDFCGTAHEIKCRKSGDTPEVPEGWAVITPMVRIKGTPNNSTPNCDGKYWNNVTEKHDIDENEEIRKLNKKKKDFAKRRSDLRAKFDKSHVCLDCIEEIHTGRRSVKIGMS